MLTRTEKKETKFYVVYKVDCLPSRSKTKGIVDIELLETFKYTQTLWLSGKRNLHGTIHIHTHAIAVRRRIQQTVLATHTKSTIFAPNSRIY